MKDKINAKLMTLFVMQYFDPRRNIVVPNVSWGLLNHEADVLVCTKQGYVTEIEIKVSKADFLKDFEKPHGHYDQRITRYYFAVPEILEDYVKEKLPDQWGLLVLRHSKTVNWKTETESHGYKIIEVVKAKRNRSEGFSQLEMRSLTRLGCLRIAGLYRENYKLRKKLNLLSKEMLDWM